MFFEFFLSVVGTAVFALMLRREMQGKPVRIWQVLTPSFLAVVISIIPVVYDPLLKQHFDIWALSLGVGFLVGAVRGLFLRLQVDQMWSIMRISRGRGALGATILMAVVVVAKFGAALAGPAGAIFHQPLTAALAWCAGYVVGRAVIVAVRVPRSPHFELRRP